MTKGYEFQLQNGLDTKKGYSFKNLGDYGLVNGHQYRNCEFKSLIRDKDQKSCGILMIYKRTDIPNGAVYYICIPTIDAADEIWKQTYYIIKTHLTDKPEVSQAVIWAMMKFNSTYLIN